MKITKVPLSLAALDAFGPAWKESEHEKPE